MSNVNKSTIHADDYFKELVCRIDATIEPGKSSPSYIFMDQCSLPADVADKLSLQWAKMQQASGRSNVNIKILDVDQLAKLIQQQSKSLVALPIARVKEMLLNTMAQRFSKDSEQLSSEFRLVVVQPGVCIRADVVIDATGSYALRLFSSLPKHELTKALKEPTKKGKQPNIEKRVKKPGIPPADANCFIGETFLRLEDGSTIRFKELACWKEGVSLPKVASWNPKTRQIVYQRPTRVITHYLDTPCEIARVKIGSSDGVGLGVTLDHPIVTVRGKDFVDAGMQEWLANERLLDPEGGKSHVINLTKSTKSSAVELYNISMRDSSGKKCGHPYYLCSHDGEEWIVAHNVPWKV